MATLKDIARDCGVSVSAVCTAINHPHKISKELREKILNRARELNYFVNKSLKIQKILLVFENYKNHFYGEYYSDVIFGITQRLSELGLEFRILSDFEIDYSEIYDYAGIIFVGKTPDTFLLRAKQYRMSCVQAGHPNPLATAPVVYQNSVNGLTQLVEYIKNCGHQDIAVLSGETRPEDVIWSEFFGYIQKEFAAKNITVYQADYSLIQSIEIAFTKILRRKKTTLILCSSDLIAYYVYKAAKKYSINIPKDISVTGFDGVFIPRFVDEPWPKLTTVFSDKVEIGRQSVNLLLDILKNPKKVKLLNPLPMQISIGDSVRRLG